MSFDSVHKLITGQWTWLTRLNEIKRHSRDGNMVFWNTQIWRQKCFLFLAFLNRQNIKLKSQERKKGNCEWFYHCVTFLSSFSIYFAVKEIETWITVKRFHLYCTAEKMKKIKKKKKKQVFPPGIEPGTFRVLGECDNRYTTETCCVE